MSELLQIGLEIFYSWSETGYICILHRVPAPDAPAGADPFSFEYNLAGYVDRLLLPGAVIILLMSGNGRDGRCFSLGIF